MSDLFNQEEMAEYNQMVSEELKTEALMDDISIEKYGVPVVMLDEIFSEDLCIIALGEIGKILSERM